MIHFLELKAQYDELHITATKVKKVLNIADENSQCRNSVNYYGEEYYKFNVFGLELILGVGNDETDEHPILLMIVREVEVQEKILDILYQYISSLLLKNGIENKVIF